MAVPFNYPRYTNNKNVKHAKHNIIITMSYIVAEELQDPNSEASVFLNSLRNTQTRLHIPTDNYSVNGTPQEHDKKGK
jgi:hypothetical protein